MGINSRWYYIVMVLPFQWSDGVAVGRGIESKPETLDMGSASGLDPLTLPI